MSDFVKPSSPEEWRAYIASLPIIGQCCECGKDCTERDDVGKNGVWDDSTEQQFHSPDDMKD